MPRIDPSLLRRLRSSDPSLAKLLPVCRDLRSARNELRWLEEHAVQVSPRQKHHKDSIQLRHDLVARRAKGEPLQYILGSEYFGDLEIKCRRGVLIPRQETAASISYLVHLLTSTDWSGREDQHSRKELRVLDLCTGTGCIPLLFHHEFYSAPSQQDVDLKLIGVDVSTDALDLAKENQTIQLLDQTSKFGEDIPRIKSLQNLAFLDADVLAWKYQGDRVDAPTSDDLRQKIQSYGRFDVLTSNPPYISPSQYTTTTSPSVRKFEPKLALVPPTVSTASSTAKEDTFYPRLLDIANDVQTGLVLFEVSDMDQALRVARMAGARKRWRRVEIWRDDPFASSGGSEIPTDENLTFRVMGQGNARSVFLSL